MSKVILRKSKRIKRKLRVRKKVVGNVGMPRISIFRSNKYVYAQLIDDTSRKTLVSVQNEVPQLHKAKTKTKAAFEVGKLMAQKCKEAKIQKAVFDRNGYRYHGRVKSFADGLREGGLKI